jgi:hypothetical protein
MARVHTADAPTTSLARRATTAYEELQSNQVGWRNEENEKLILAIRNALAALGIESAGEPFINTASARPCIPLIQGGWDEETESYIHIVAAEWDEDESALALVADLDLDEDWRPNALYPAGALSGLADIGRAVVYGGSRRQASPITPHAIIQDLFGRAFGEATSETTAMVLSAEAVCTALLDVADAIRETAAS